MSGNKPVSFESSGNTQTKESHHFLDQLIMLKVHDRDMMSKLFT